MSKCWYCNEELTTANYCDEHIGICTKCYNSMFKVGNDFVKGLTDKIADLEAKLAESEREKQEFLIKYKYWRTECEQLKQQLADKEKEIKSLRSSAYIDMLHKEMLELKVATQHQDKISFCIEQLKWVEKLLLDNAFNDLSVVLEEIDNQIEELKKEMK